MKLNQIKFTSLLLGLSLTAAAANTLHATEYHVSLIGSDTNAGLQAAPFRTIQHAADLAQPGDVITVHEGVYRERINPPRGGESDAKRIVYQAAPGEKVVITGSEIVKLWEHVTNDAWQVKIPNSFFGKFNPYSDLIHGDWYKSSRPNHTGAVYLNGDWLREATNIDSVTQPAAATPSWFGVVSNGVTTITAQFKGVNPNNAQVEINVRQTVFTPSKTGVNYITVRGFDLRNAATPWAPPSAGQIGIVSAYWCKGWIIENNEVSYSTCSGIALGKYSDEFDNTNFKGDAEPYTDCVRRALTNGWNKETIGSHIVRNNNIHHCEQCGIVGSLGCAFSKVIGNEIHDIHVRGLFGGWEMAGIKFHGAVDVEISHNHIYRVLRNAIWLDWMAQGTRVTANFMHDNLWDLSFEANHGPILADNNLLLSGDGVNVQLSQGCAFVHNFIKWKIASTEVRDSRQTPFLKPHSLMLAGLTDNPKGDARYFNNILGTQVDLSPYDNSILPVTMTGNVYLKGATPAKFEKEPLLKHDFDPAIKVIEKPDGWYLEMAFDKEWSKEQSRQLVTTDLLGKAVVPNQSFENPDGSSLKIDTDYFGQKRDEQNPFPGPFEISKSGTQTIKVWPNVSSASLAH